MAFDNFSKQFGVKQAQIGPTEAFSDFKSEFGVSYDSPIQPPPPPPAPAVVAPKEPGVFSKFLSDTYNSFSDAVKRYENRPVPTTSTPYVNPLADKLGPVQSVSELAGPRTTSYFTNLANQIKDHVMNPQVIEPRSPLEKVFISGQSAKKQLDEKIATYSHPISDFLMSAGKGIAQSLSPVTGDRKRNFGDIVNMIPAIIVASGLPNAVLSITEAVSNQLYGETGGEVAFPTLNGEKIVAQGVQTNYDKRIAAGESPDRAFWLSSLSMGIDLAVLIPMFRGMAKLGVAAINPESLLKETIFETAKIKEFLQTGKPMPKDIQDVFKTLSNDEKAKVARGLVTQIIEPKPSTLGKILGVSDAEAKLILDKINNTPATPAPTPLQLETRQAELVQEKAALEIKLAIETKQANESPTINNTFNDLVEQDIKNYKTPVERQADKLEAGFKRLNEEKAQEKTLSLEKDKELTTFMQKTGGFLTESDIPKFKEKYGNIAVVVKDVNGQRARMSVGDFDTLSKNKGFSDRIRAVFIGSHSKELNIKPEFDKLFMEALQPKKLLEGESEPQNIGTLSDMGDIKLTADTTISKVQQGKFVTAITDDRTRFLLRENGIKEINIQPPYKFQLSEQGHIQKGKKIINISADATDPNNTILHELGHAKFEDLSKEEQDILIERAKNYNNSEMAGYQKNDAWEEVIADSLYTRPDFAPEYYNKDGRKVDPIDTAHDIANIEKQLENINYQLAEAAAQDALANENAMNESIRKLTLEPSKAKTEQEQVAEINKLFNEKGVKEQTRQKRDGTVVPTGPLVSRTDISQIIKDVPEFKKNPVMTVNENMELEWKGEKTSFKIRAEALGLQPANLKVGDSIRVDPITLKAKGAAKQMRVVDEKGDVLASEAPSKVSGQPAKYDPDVLPKLSGQLGGVHKIKPVEMPELVRLTRELMGNFPTIVKKTGKAAGRFYAEGNGRIKIVASLFDKASNNISQAARVLAHEIGHLIDYLPEGTLKRGNLLGRLESLRKFMQATFTKENGEIINNKVIRTELLKVTKYWHPYDPKTVTPSYKAYRESAVELYADAVSVLFNDPGKLEQMAPTFYKEFFDGLDTKPDAKEAFFSLQELLNGTPEEIFKARQDDILKGFARAEAIQAEFRAKKKLSVKSLWERFRQQVDDINYLTLKKQKEAEMSGKIFSDEDNPKFLLEEQSLVDNENFLFVGKLNKEITQPIEKAGMTNEDIGQYLMLHRIKTERAEIANPYGFNPKNAEDQLDFMKQQLGEENFNLLEEKVKLFHDIVFPSVEEAVKVGSYNTELFYETILPNKDNYAAFQVVDYMQDHVPAGIKAQVGTLKEISNPYVSTILKIVSLNRLNAYQRAKNAVIKNLKDNFPLEISETRRITSDGKLSVFRPEQDKGTIEVLENGKMQSYDIDPYMAESFKRDKVGDLNMIVSLIEKFNNELFKPVVTTFNLGFAAGTNPIRDFKRNYKNIPNATVYSLLKAYGGSFKDAIQYAKGNLTEFTKSLVESKAIAAPMNDYNYDSIDSQFSATLERFGLIAEKETSSNAAIEALRKILVPTIGKVLRGIQFTANSLEILSKVAGAKVRIAGGESGAELAHNIRNYTGTPNFRNKGSQTKTTNAIWVFSNIMKEGIKSDFQIATDPKTRSGFWWKTVKVDLMPKFLQFLATAGVLGVGLKEFYDNVSEYDLTNYIIIPLGTYNDKSVYFRIPHDETGRLLSAIFWKMANFARTGNLKQAQQIFALGAGQFPSFSPIISNVLNWTQYLSGKNPYDSFRGRNIIDDTTWQAGGGAALKKMVQSTTNSLGLTKFATYDDVQQTGTETFFQVAPWFSSMIKISDYGVQEKLKAVANEQKTVEARQTLRVNEAISNNLKSAVHDKENMTTYAKNVIIESLGPVPVEGSEQMIKDYSDNAKKILNKFAKAVVTGNLTDPIEKAISGATSNAQKAAMLDYVKADKSKDEFKNLIVSMLEDKTITLDVLLKMNREK